MVSIITKQTEEVIGGITFRNTSYHELVVIGYNADSYLMIMDPGTGKPRKIERSEVVPRYTRVITGIK